MVAHERGARKAPHSGSNPDAASIIGAILPLLLPLKFLLEQKPTKQSMLEVAFGSGLRVVRRHLVVYRFLIYLMTQESGALRPGTKGREVLRRWALRISAPALAPGN